MPAPWGAAAARSSPQRLEPRRFQRIPLICLARPLRPQSLGVWQEELPAHHARGAAPAVPRPLSPAGAGSHHGAVPVPLFVSALPLVGCPPKPGCSGECPLSSRCRRASVSLPSHQGPLSAHSAAVGVGFYGNSETNDGVFQLLYALDHANQTLTGIDSLVGPRPLRVPHGAAIPCPGFGLSTREGRPAAPAEPPGWLRCAEGGRVTSPHRMGPLWPSRAGKEAVAGLF